MSDTAVPPELIDELSPFVLSSPMVAGTRKLRTSSLLRAKRSSIEQSDQSPALRSIEYWNGEHVRIEVFEDHFSWMWTSPLESPRLAEIFATDLTKVAAMRSEAAFSTSTGDFLVPPEELPQHLQENPDTNWFRVNLPDESFVWIAPEGLGDDRLKQFAVISNSLDFRLIAALMVKTGSVLVRSSLRSYLTDLGFVGRNGPGVSVRKPSLLAAFLQLDSSATVEDGSHASAVASQ